HDAGRSDRVQDQRKRSRPRAAHAARRFRQSAGPARHPCADQSGNARHLLLVRVNVTTGRSLAMRKTMLATAMAFCASTASAQQAPPPEQDMAAVFAAQNRIPDTPGSGPYPALMEVDPAHHVVYRPA